MVSCVADTHVTVMSCDADLYTDVLGELGQLYKLLLFWRGHGAWSATSSKPDVGLLMCYLMYAMVKGRHMSCWRLPCAAAQHGESQH